jgi:hypothetical protein
MSRQKTAGLFVLFLLGPAAPAQAPEKAGMFWKTGQVLSYKVEHVTYASDQVGDAKTETKSKLQVTKRWQVLEVDKAGIATLQLSLTSLMQERTTPKGEVLRFDSANPEKSTPQLKEVFSKFLDKPISKIRVDARGQVVEVIETKFGTGSSFENELPFVTTLPAGPWKGEASWDRTYKITLDPPLGTGEKYDAVQQFTCKALKNGLATVALTTQVKNPPKAAADGIPLWQMMPQGEAVFDLKTGRLESANLKIERELKGHNGEKSLCKFDSTYSVRYLGDK